MKNIQRVRRLIQSMFLILFIMGVMAGVPAINIGIAILCILGGVFYCGWICPFGMIQDIVSKIGDKLGIRRKRVSRRWHFILSKQRYIIFICAIILSVSFIFEVLSYDPRSNLLAILTGREIGYAAIGVIIIFLLASIFYERFFCNYLCMEGAKYGLMSVFRPFNIKRDNESCIQCGKCSRVCPMRIDVANNEDVRSLQCINCLKCVSSCPKKDTLKFGLRNFGKVKIKKVRIIICAVVVLLLGFKLLGGKDNHHHSPNVENETVQEEATTSNEVGTYKDGKFNGVGRGFKGDMTAEVTIKDGIITNVEVIKNVDDRNWFNRANNVIPDEIKNAQSTEVDVVTGATYSSKGIINAVKDALEKAEDR